MRAVDLSGEQGRASQERAFRPESDEPRSINQATICCVAGGFRFAVVARILSGPGPLVPSSGATPSPSVAVARMVSAPAMVMMSAMR